MYFFQVNNQTTLTLDKNNGGKVGIGTTAPTTKTTGKWRRKNI